MKTFQKLLFMLLSTAVVSCNTNEIRQDESKKVWAWLEGSLEYTPDVWENYFSEAKNIGIDAIILQVHGGYPKVEANDTTLTDNEAIEILQNASAYAKKHDIELHAWIWTTNRCEKNLRAMHPDWYQVNRDGNSCLDIKLYNREHYRWLCPSRPEVLVYLQNRVAELAKIDGVAGVHLDFIRYPDAMLPYGLHESRGVVQDKFYPQWDHCYCDFCRAEFKNKHGIDPMKIEEPSENTDWMKFRWDAVTKLTNALANEIHKHKKSATAAVFASPEESRKLVRQDWSRFTELDVIFPMIYHKFYNWNDEMIETATREGVDEMQANNCKGYLCSGLFVGHVPADNIEQLVGYATKGGSRGICFFSLKPILKSEEYAQKMKEFIAKFKE